MNFLTNLLGPNAPLAATFIVAFAAVLVLIGLTAWVFRLIRGKGLGIGLSGRGRQPRLAVLDYADVDQRRKLVLIRRDNVEHLLLLGGPTDVVVETSIVRGVPVQASALREAAATTEAPQASSPATVAEQPRMSMREAARQAAGETAPARPVNLDFTPPSRPEPRVETRPAPPEPPRAEPPKIETPKVEAPRVEAPRVVTPRVEPPRTPPVSSPVSTPLPPRPVTPPVAPPQRVETPVVETPVVEAPKPQPAMASLPPRPVTPPAPPAVTSAPTPAADDIAARLEAALRKPIGSSALPPRPVTPPVASVLPPAASPAPSTPAPSTPAASSPPSAPPAPAAPLRTPSPPLAASAAASASAASSSAPTPPKALSADERSVFDSLEEEMAALLGRGPAAPKS